MYCAIIVLIIFLLFKTFSARLHPNSFEMFGRVALTGEPTLWEHYLAALYRWFSFSISIYSPTRREVVMVTENITARKETEQEKEDYNCAED